MNLKEAREKAGFDTATLAVKSKVSMSTINNIESGRYKRYGSEVKPSTKRKLCKALKIKPEELEV